MYAIKTSEGYFAGFSEDDWGTSSDTRNAERFDSLREASTVLVGLVIRGRSGAHTAHSRSYPFPHIVRLEWVEGWQEVGE